MSKTTNLISSCTICSDIEFIKYCKDNFQSLHDNGVTYSKLRVLQTSVYKMITPAYVRQLFSSDNEQNQSLIKTLFSDSLAFLICQVRLQPQLNLSRFAYETPARHELFIRILQIFKCRELKLKSIVFLSSDTSNMQTQKRLLETQSKLRKTQELETEFLEFVRQNKSELHENGVDKHSLNAIGALYSNCQTYEITAKLGDQLPEIVQDFVKNLRDCVCTHELGSKLLYFKDDALFRSIESMFQNLPTSNYRKQQFQQYYKDLNDNDRTKLSQLQLSQLKYDRNTAQRFYELSYRQILQQTQDLNALKTRQQLEVVNTTLKMSKLQLQEHQLQQKQMQIFKLYREDLHTQQKRRDPIAQRSQSNINPNIEQHTCLALYQTGELNNEIDRQIHILTKGVK